MATPKIKSSKYMKRAIADSAKIGFEFSRSLDEGAWITIERRGDLLVPGDSSIGRRPEYENANVVVWADIDELTLEEIMVYGGIDVASDKKFVMQTPVYLDETIKLPVINSIKQDSDNTGNANLKGAFLGALAIAETFTLTFVDAVRYDIYGDISLTDGQGRIDEDSISISERLIIKREGWENTPVAGDIFRVEIEVHIYDVWKIEVDSYAYLWLAIARKAGEE